MVRRLPASSKLLVREPLFRASSWTRFAQPQAFLSFLRLPMTFGELVCKRVNVQDDPGGAGHCFTLAGACSDAMRSNFSTLLPGLLSYTLPRARGKYSTMY
eukprot:scaffold182177_cov18-Tisochrysis_lutea.AAC.1